MVVWGELLHGLVDEGLAVWGLPFPLDDDMRGVCGADMDRTLLAVVLLLLLLLTGGHRWLHGRGAVAVLRTRWRLPRVVMVHEGVVLRCGAGH